MHPLLPVPDADRFPAPPPAQPALLPAGEHHRSPTDAADAAVTEQLLAERIVVVSGELDDAAAHRLISRLLLLDAVDRSDITLLLSGTGGTTTATLAVRDVLGHVRPDVATWAVGIVAGAAQMLLTAGTPGKRHALPQARIQLCRPAIGALGAVGGPARAQLTGLAAGDAGRPVDEFTAALDAGDWFTAAQAKDYGLIDRIGRKIG